ncbi:MAG: hypothetical protein FWE45_02805 [Firmicutes bacterium]|nr:hypothetical protein [Bacillota bacterium]
MTNKRLLAILIVFIVVAGLAVAGGSIFRIREVNIQFTTPELDFLQPYEARLLNELHAELGFVIGRSSIFGVDRNRITRTIENHDPRIRWTNTEVFAPNRLQISIRERFPVFQFGNYALCMDLRYVVQANRILPNRPLINITSGVGTGGIELPNDAQFVLGTFMRDLIPVEQPRDLLLTNRLIDLAYLFWGQDLREDGITSLISSIYLNDWFEGERSMRLNFRNPLASQHLPYETVVSLRGIDNQTHFREMLTHVWDVRAAMSQDPGHYIAYMQGGRAHVSLIV